MKFTFSLPWLKALSNICGNLSAGWFASVFIAPGIAGQLNPVILTINFLIGIVYLLITVKIEQILETYE